MFRKYQHIERLGTDEVDGIELGTVWVFPKIDGTNGSVWVEIEKDRVNFCAGSRTRDLCDGADNQGFLEYVVNDSRIRKYLIEHPDHRLFGEWLVPHSLKTYREDAWRKFYIFDVAIDTTELVTTFPIPKPMAATMLSQSGLEYLPYETYQPLLEEFDLDYIPPICSIKNATYEQFVNQLEKNVFLVEDGKGSGEGIVIKNYDFHNRFGRQKWAKIVTSEFKEKHVKEMGAPDMNGRKMVEEEICETYCTEALIEKTYEKIRNEKDGWRSQYIPELLGRVWHDLVSEECWNFVKKHKNPTINFKTLNHFVVNKIKETKPILF